MQHLKKAGVQAMVHYPNALCDTPLFVGYAQESDVPEARRATRTVLSLPIYAELSRSEAEVVVGAIREYYGQ
jgi:dTDP-4-amino-4,6-dideoxygalactose transaminase